MELTRISASATSQQQSASATAVNSTPIKPEVMTIQFKATSDAKKSAVKSEKRIPAGAAAAKTASPVPTAAKAKTGVTAVSQPAASSASAKTAAKAGSAETPVVLPQGTSTGLEAAIKKVLTPDAAGKIHEEELQYAIVTHLLNRSKSGAGDEFQKIFGSLIGTGKPPLGTEDATKRALEKLVSSGTVDLKTAEQINGASFEAAQLDAFTNLLFDGTGGANDATIAVMAIDQAAAKAETALKKMEQPDSQTLAKSLAAPSNGVMSSSELNGKDSGKTVQAGNIDPKGFLWKPFSANDGKLVVLLPKSMTGSIKDCAIYRDLPPSAENLIERGKYSGDANGDRSHFRFTHPGSYFPQKCYVVAETKKGAEVAFEISSPSSRNSV